MTLLFGQPFLTDFARARLLQRLTQICPEIQDIDSCQVFAFADDLADADLPRACELLGATNTPHITPTLYVAPRFGTISPWASKATDIFNNASLTISRVERIVAYTLHGAPDTLPAALIAALHDVMTQSVFFDLKEVRRLFLDTAPAALNEIDVLAGGLEALKRANAVQGFALSDADMDYLVNAYQNLGRNPTDVELMMFAQANSEHCRHKIFNAAWDIDGRPTPKSLFGMIKNTHQTHPNHTTSAYKDNAAVVLGFDAMRFYPKTTDAGRQYGFFEEPIDILMKVETHNHPTAIAPFAGAATGAGGEIRDEGATGRGGKPKAGLTGFHVSHLHLPNAPLPHEAVTKPYGKPDRMASALDIMTEGPLGAAAFNNEFGRPNLCGYFRAFQHQEGEQMYGYHKPIMLAGGYGNIKRNLTQKDPIQDKDLLIVLGGPAMQIGLGGGAASSFDSGALDEGLDFASVQRDNAEMERRAQEVIDHCWSLDINPIVSIHDVGAGGLSNAMPELVNDHGLGGVFDIRAIPSLEMGMSPMAIWSNEAQERYVLAIRPESLGEFDAICARERCPYAVLGHAQSERQLVVNDALLPAQPVDLPMSVLLGDAPRLQKSITRTTKTCAPLDLDVDLKTAVFDVLRHPTVGSKEFLISIGDRSITGMVVRDQMVGRYQVPVADVAVTACALIKGVGAPMTGEAMAMGERTPLALIDARASARLAVAEAITNILSAKIDALEDITLSANWMAALGSNEEDAALYEAVHEVGEVLCPALGINIPVGKDSLSMRVKWTDESGDKSVVSPMSLVISAFGRVSDVTATKTPELVPHGALYHLDLGRNKARLGGSILAQTQNQMGNEAPNLDDPQDLIDFFHVIKDARLGDKIAAYHDISDGGLITTVAEMMFASRLGVALEIDHPDLIAALFAEELGAVVQVTLGKEDAFLSLCQSHNMAVKCIGYANDTDALEVKDASGAVRFCAPRAQLQEAWASVSHAIAKLRDNPKCADMAYEGIRRDDVGLLCQPTFDPNAKMPHYPTRPKVAILREQGVNGQLEMAAGFTRAGFDAIDVHMSDLLLGRHNLGEFVGLVACGGFSYGDVLGAGSGWARSILFNTRLKDAFATFFHRGNTFTLGVCNGCQMVSQLKDLIPDADHFPRFVHNVSGRFEARTTSVLVEDSASVLLSGMAGSILPIAVAHGEGLVQGADVDALLQSRQGVLRYVDAQGNPTERYPQNPNGSTGGLTGVCSSDGRVTIMMPHPERTLNAFNHSYLPPNFDLNGRGMWFELFKNARKFVG